ncbi:peptidylprolyl isomerase [Candidatus Woesearchaeota archaeon]|nr:peptidylprolyl isomerase [Candidatus Woesearchaeota archaeon]
MKNEQVKKGDIVSLDYTGSLQDGTEFDSSKGKSPLQFEVGAGEVIPGFDKAVEGMKIDEEKTFTILCAEAYGPIQAELMQEIPKEKMPNTAELKVGMQLMMNGPQGEKAVITITKISDKTVTADLNHPLAGKDLTFKVKVVGINLPREENGCCGGGCGEGKECNHEGSTEVGCCGSCK